MPRVAFFKKVLKLASKSLLSQSLLAHSYLEVNFLEAKIKDSQKILNISLKKGNLSTFLVESCSKMNNLPNDAHF